MDKNKLNKIVGKNIKKYRLKYNNEVEAMTQEMLAEKIDVSASLISSLESIKTKKGISINNLYKISIILNTPISNFLKDDENEK